jgi:hypothetical protein
MATVSGSFVKALLPRVRAYYEASYDKREVVFSSDLAKVLMVLAESGVENTPPIEYDMPRDTKYLCYGGMAWHFDHDYTLVNWYDGVRYYTKEEIEL